jgi:hypothetical protein
MDFMTNPATPSVIMDLSFSHQKGQIVDDGLPRQVAVHAGAEREQVRDDVDEVVNSRNLNQTERAWLIEYAHEMLIMRETYSEERVLPAVQHSILAKADGKSDADMQHIESRLRNVVEDANSHEGRAFVYALINCVELERELVHLEMKSPGQDLATMRTELYGPLFKDGGAPNTAAPMLLPVAAVSEHPLALPAGEPGEEPPVVTVSPENVTVEVGQPVPEKSQEPRACRACDTAGSSACRQS